MISTKRMDSSFGKNAANRVEESYSDARIPPAPPTRLHSFFSLSALALETEADTASGSSTCSSSLAGRMTPMTQCPGPA